MDKMRMESVDITAQNIEKISSLFPNCITEMLDEEKSTIDNKVYKKAVISLIFARQDLDQENPEILQSALAKYSLENSFSP